MQYHIRIKQEPKDYRMQDLIKVTRFGSVFENMVNYWIYKKEFEKLFLSDFF